MKLGGLQICVIGAGVGGLAAALALRGRGAEVTVLEQAEAIREVGAGLQISPNGLAVIRALGLEPALAATAVRGEAVVLRDYRRAGEVMRLDLAQPDAGQPYYFVHRSDLIDMLASAVRAAGVQVRLLQKVAGVKPGVEPGARPTVHLASGAQITPDLIIGADGVRSVVRPSVTETGPPVFTGQVAWRALVPTDDTVPAEVRVHMGPGRHLVSYPLRRGQFTNIVAVQERQAWAEEGWHHNDDPANLRAAFADFRGPAQALLGAVDQVALWGLFRHPVAPHWHRGAIVLVGDAAHPTLPFLAQGANMALEDAWVLADCLTAASDIGAGLSAYQARRHGRVVRVIAAANGNAWKYHLRFPPLRGAAHLALGIAGKVAPGRMLRQFDWLYGHDVTCGGQRSSSTQTGT